MKKFLALILSLVMVLALVACGGKDEPKDDPEEPTGPVNVVFWNVLTGNGGDLMQKWAEEFNASQDKYTIEMTYAGAYAEALAKYQSTTAGNRPDVVMVSTEYVAFFADNPEYFVPVQKYIDEDKYDTSDIMANLRASYSDKDGKMLCMPIGNTVVGFFYNNEVLTANGIDIANMNSYEEIYDACLTLKKAGVQYPFYIAPNSIYYTFPVTAEGMDYVDQNNGKDALCTKTLIMEDAKLKATTEKFFQILADMKKNDMVAPTDLAAADARQMFVDGNIAFFCATISGTNAIGTLCNWELDFGFHPAVTVNKGAQNIGQCTGGGTLFLGNNNNPAAERGAWEFLKYILGAQQTADFALATGYLPTTMSGFNTDTYQTYVKEKFPTATDAMEAQKATPEDCYNALLPMFGDFHQIGIDYINNIIADPNQDIAKYTEDFAAALDECIELYALQKG